MENESSLSTKSSISNRYETIVIGDAYCGKTSYLLALAEHERKMNMPIHVSQDKSEYEFCVENKSKKIIFAVKDTANQERFRSLTQSYYRKAQCVLLMFDLLNEESFYNLGKWYTDIMSYCKSQDNSFAIILVGIKNIKNKPDPNDSGVYSSTFTSIEPSLIEKFKLECSNINGYCEIDFDNHRSLKEPFKLLLEHFVFLNESRSRSSPAALSRRSTTPDLYSNFQNDKITGLANELVRKGSIYSIGTSAFRVDSPYNYNLANNNNESVDQILKDKNLKSDKKCCIIL